MFGFGLIKKMIRRKFPVVRHEFYVYGYFYPNGTPCYIGKGKGNRWLSHLKSTQNKHLASVIQKYGVQSIPITIIRENLTEKEALDVEEMLTKVLGLQINGTGCLVNSIYGGGLNGCSGIPHSKERRELRSKIAISQWKDPKYRAKVLRPGRNRSGNTKPRSAERRQEVRLQMLGNSYGLGTKRTEAQCEKMSKDRKGKPKSEQHRKAIAKSLLGKKHSPERVENISKSLTGRKQSPEHVAKRKKTIEKLREQGLIVGRSRIDTGLFQANVRVWSD